ncbi:vacuolar protein sorting-associated protein 2 2 [Cinnamomum micranthum f. kanehirae]|uniref:Vacuolar protein sorting-associated protein 2 2 n=1 Tax=Cinnamomum micranthum f. kanehirae TaxID=337451 RepID=A0A3S3QQ77_9MAGN|nr:vacuolar protein sorting-associated protein 2 2 [Cinnamomum micranthum f. kanehirae]
MSGATGDLKEVDVKDIALQERKKFVNLRESAVVSRSDPSSSSCSTMNIFKKKTSAKGIEREIASLQLEAATRILARQLVRLRQQITNLQGSRAQIRGVATHTQAMYANTSISVGMKGASKAMAAMNKQLAPAKQAKVMQEFQKQSAQMDMTIEMMSEVIDETLDKDEAEEETEELTNQVLDEIGVDIASQLSSAPKGRIAGKKAEVQNAARTASPDVDDLEKSMASPDIGDLEKRFASLRRI